VTDDLPERIRGTTDAPAPVDPAVELDGNVEFKERIRQQTQRYETDLIVEALRRTQGHQVEAAKLLGMPVRTLAHKMKELGIKKTFG
jgi:DNA-binding NtrC family response regulator